MAEAMVLGPHAPDKRRSLVTPEGVDLSLGLAGGGQRVGAFLIDLTLMLFALIALTLLVFWIGSAAVRGGDTVALEIVAAIWLLGFFLIRNFYFILFEGGRRAATLGKRAVGLRVVARSGERLTLESVVARNMMREIEVYLPISYLAYSIFDGEENGLLGWVGALWVLLFLLFPLFNKDRLRVGDL
ncbi:MAG TPA: RDD family protein, partial [Allosphingosinicella sp.]